MEREFSFIKKNRIILFFIIILSSFLFFCYLGSKSLWFDESLSYFISLKWDSLVKNIIESRGNRSPYYFILHFWLIMGNSEFVLRSLSGIFGVLSVICIYFLGKKLWDKKIGLIASFLLGINVFFIEYAREARNYSMLVFLIILSSLFLLEYRKKEKKLFGILYVIIATLSIYTHIFSLLVIFSQIVSYLVFAENRKESFLNLLPFGVVIFLFSILPLSLFFSYNEYHASWIEKPRMGEFFLLLRMFSGGWILFFVFFFFVLLFFIRNWKNLSRYNYCFTVCCFLLPMLIVFPISYFLKPVYVPRYMIIVLPFYVLMIANSIAKTKKCLFISIFILALSLRSFWFYYSKVLPKEDWKNLYEFVSKRYDKKDDCIVFYAYFVKYPFLYYAKNSIYFDMNLIELSSKSYPMGGGIELPMPDKQKIDNIARKYKKVWLILSHYKLKGIKRIEQAVFVINEMSKNYNLFLKKHFKGIDVMVFVRKK